ncbi:hypothetical protein B0H34DRAFT_800054 [Crassisporium funariophilum]|nr:hypothetical protein B0H34DRAFT_800054 [Crassisporium funariophilum]
MESAEFPQELIDLFIDELNAQDDDASWQALKSCSLVSNPFRRRAAQHLFQRIRTRRRGFTLSEQIAQTHELRNIIQNNHHFRSCIRVLEVDAALGTPPSAIHEIMDIMMLEGQIHGSGGGIHTFELCGSLWESMSIEFQSSILKFVMGGTSTVQQGPLRSIRFTDQRLLSPLLLTSCTGTVTDLTLHDSQFLVNYPRDSTAPSIRLKSLCVALCLANFIATLNNQSATVILSELESFVLHTGAPNSQVGDALAKVLLLTAETLRTLEIRQKFSYASIRSALPWCTDLGLLPRLTFLRLYFEAEDATRLYTLKPALQLLDPSLHSSTSIQTIEIVVDILVKSKANAYTICYAQHGWKKLDEDLASQRCCFLRTVSILTRVGLAYAVVDEQKELASIRRNHNEHLLSTFTNLSASTSVNLNIVVEIFFRRSPST